MIGLHEQQFEVDIVNKRAPQRREESFLQKLDRLDSQSKADIVNLKG